MRSVKINFVDFWRGFDPYNNYFVNSLEGKVAFEISDDPDILFFSYGGKAHLDYQCHKIQYLGENVTPDFRIADYAMSFDYLQQPNHLRLPLYIMWLQEKDAVGKLISPKSDAEVAAILEKKTGFCSFHY